MATAQPPRPAPRYLSRLRWFLVAVTLVCMVAGALRAVHLLKNAGQSGLLVTWPDTVVSTVKPGSAAEAAGLRAGDVLALERMTLGDVLRTLNFVDKYAGTDVHVAAVRNGRPFAAEMFPRNPYLDERFASLTIFALIEGFCIACLCLAVLVRSASIEAIVFWAFACAAFVNPESFAYRMNDETALWFSIAMQVFLSVAGTAGALLLALQATGNPARRRRYQGIALIAGGFAGAITGYCDLSLLVLRQPPPGAVILAARGFDLFTYCLIAVIVFVALIRTSGMARIRTRWLCVGLGALVLEGLLADALALAFPGTQYALWPSLVGLAFNLVGFGALAFSVARNELFDVGFVVNRTAIYTATTALLIATFAAINWSAGTVLKSTGMALPVEVLLAGALGLSLNLVHRRVDQAIDRLFFRSRYKALERLGRVARGLVQARDLDVVSSAVVRETCEALELSSGALFRLADDGYFHRLAEWGWPADAPDTIPAGDPLLIHLAGVTDSLRLDGVPHTTPFPGGALRPRIAFPLWSRGQLVGAALFSAHRTGAALDPEEVKAVEGVVGAAVSAFDRVDAEALRTAMEELHELRAERDLLAAKLAGAYATSVLRTGDRA